MKNVIVVLCLALLLTGCKGRSVKKDEARQPAATTAEAVANGKPKTFPYVQPPAMITDRMEAVQYAAQHFWDKFDFTDTSYVNLDITKEAFAHYLLVLMSSPEPIARASMKAMLEKASANQEMYDYFVELYNGYLDDPNSEMRNEEMFIVFLEVVLADPNLDEYAKLRPQDQLETALKNRVGTKANDFRFRPTKGKDSTLYNIKADYVLLFFYNLGCPACKGVREGLLEVFAEPTMAKMIADGRLKVLAFYPDEDMTEWDKYVNDIPSDWTNAWDPWQNMREGEGYSLRAIPSLYLLDKDKNVLLKDFVDPAAVYYIIAERENLQQ